MNSREFIDQVEACVFQNWRNSLLWRETEQAMELIAQHLQECEECRELFDAMEYPEKTLLDMENRHSFKDLSDWTCEK